MENRKSIGLPGGPNEFLKEITQHISVEGYKRYSKDVNNPYNIIESGNITMEDVDFPVKGTDNLGNEQMMMPGMNYQFPGDSVLEVPMAQVGGEQATLSAYEEPAWYEKVLDRLASPMTALGYTARNQDVPANLPINMEERNAHDSIIDTFNPFAWIKYGAQANRDLEEGEYLDAGLNILGALPIVPAWLSRTKKVLPPAVVNKIATYTDDVVKGANKFESSIDWAKWNKEIPNNKALMKEYNAIEQAAKLDGTWMTDIDSNIFGDIERIDLRNAIEFAETGLVKGKEATEGYKKIHKQLLTKLLKLKEEALGTPEQFVQRRSKNYKEAFPNDPLKTYRGAVGTKTYNGPLDGKAKNLGSVFTTGKDEAIHYGSFSSSPLGEKKGGQGLLELLYNQSDNSLDFSAKGSGWNSLRTDLIPESNLKSSISTRNTTTDDIASRIEDLGIDYVNIRNIYDGVQMPLETIFNHRTGNYLKSAIGNNGMFDMTNPNIYKAIVPGAIGLGAASQMTGPVQADGQYQQGGSLPKAQVGDKVASIASQMEVNEEDGGRPPLGVVDHIIALFDEEGLCRDNTCVQTVKDFYSKAGVKAMPEDVYNNREFLKNFKEYGFEEILDQKNLQPGDVLQYYYNKDSEGIDVNQDLLNFPYHMGVYVNPGEYIGDGDSESPIQRQNMYTGTRKDGTEYKKDPFRAFRYIKQNKNGGSLPKAQDGREHEIAVVPDSKAIENSFQRQWLDSPMYNEMLANEVGPGDDSEFLTFGRKSNLENLPISMTSGKHEDDEGIAADVDNVSGRITFYEPSQIGGGGRVYKNMFEHEVGHSSDRMSDETEKKYIESLSLMDKAALAIQNYGGKANEAYNFITGQDSNDFQDRGRQIERNLNVDILIPEKTIQGFTDQRFNIEGYDENGNPIINSYDAAYYENFDEKGRPIVSFNQDGSIKEKNIGIDKDSWADYVSNPTEARTRLNTIRAAAKDLGIYDPFTEKLTPEKFEELKGFRLDRGNDNSYNPLKQLQGIYNDEEIFNMLNTVSDATKNISNDRYGQRGGEQNKSEDITKEGFDWGGYFSGEQGWIPDYDGVPTLQMFDKQPVKQEVKQEVVEKVKEEQSFTITPQLLYKQAFIESNLDPKAKNSKGYKGLGQIGDNLISDYKKANKVDKIDPFDPKQNYAVHSWSMNELYNSSFIDKPGSTNEVKLAKALAAYNWGRGNMLKFLNDKKEKGVDIYKSTDWLSELPKETREYIDMIMYDGSTEGRPKVQENFIKTTTDNLYKPLRTLYGYKQGGEINELDMYKNYIDGVYNEADQEVDAQKIYDKLNRIHYKDAKSLGMSPANYILTHVMAKA